MRTQLPGTYTYTTQRIMKLNTNHQYVKLAIIRLREHTLDYKQSEFNKLFESKYHCTIHIDPTDPWATTGAILFNEEKYYNWFLLQFQGESVE